MLKGIDVSKFQGSIDWGKVKAGGIQFAIIRASYGKTGVDVSFKANMDGAKKAGMPVGAYHYCYAKSIEDARQEAQHFLDVIRGYRLEYPACLDIEDKSQQGLGKSLVTNIAITFLEVLEGAGYFAAIYANKYWFTNVLDDSRLSPYCHWLAQYASKPMYRGDYGIWQYSSTGSVPGINGNVDMNISYRDFPSEIKSRGKNGYDDSPGSAPSNNTSKPGIREIQHIFNNMLGGRDIAEDNIYGPNTQAAAEKVILKTGSKNDAVKWLQRKLNYLGYKCGSADGIFGPKTDAAVRAFQRAKKLSADGIVGANTWRALLNA